VILICHRLLPIQVDPLKFARDQIKPSQTTVGRYKANLRYTYLDLLIDPGLFTAFVGRDTFREPKRNLFLRRFNSVTSVTNVATNLNAEIATDGSHGRIAWHGGACRNYVRNTKQKMYRLLPEISLSYPTSFGLQERRSFLPTPFLRPVPRSCIRSNQGRTSSSSGLRSGFPYVPL
jgi:hypothetical protein